jgi:hypothetical protein
LSLVAGFVYIFEDIMHTSLFNRLIYLGLILAITLVGIGIDTRIAHAAPVNCADTGATGVPEAECLTLMTLYNNTNGQFWRFNSNWGTNTPVRTWHGVSVIGGYVSEIRFSQTNYLNGSLPDLTALTHLWYIEMHGERLTGGLPPLPNSLQEIHMYGNQLTGSIPTLPPFLEYVDLTGNFLSGSIPPLPNSLRTLWLFNNYLLSGSLPPLPPLLRYLDVHNNQLSGSIPALPSTLHVLDLSNNQIVSEIPSSITSTSIDPVAGGSLALCGGSTITWTPDPTVAAWVQAISPGWTQYCGTGMTPPTANADSSYATLINVSLNQAAPGVLANDTLGLPTAVLTSFGGGSLGGGVTDHAAGSSVALAGGTLTLNADGSFALAAPATAGTYTFQYRVTNSAGTSDALVTLTVLTNPVVPPGPTIPVIPPAPMIPPPPPAPQCNNMDFAADAVMRAWIPDSYRTAVYCHVIMQNGNYIWWYGSPLTNPGEIGIRALIDLDARQAVDVFAPSGPSWFDGGAVVCLKGSGSLWFLPASEAPRTAHDMTEYTVEEFAGYTCTTLWESGTLVLTNRELTE